VKQIHYDSAPQIRPFSGMMPRVVICYIDKIALFASKWKKENPKPKESSSIHSILS
jgi:hypothetical protein